MISVSSREERGRRRGSAGDAVSLQNAAAGRTSRTRARSPACRQSSEIAAATAQQQQE